MLWQVSYSCEQKWSKWSCTVVDKIVANHIQLWSKVLWQVSYSCEQKCNEWSTVFSKSKVNVLYNCGQWFYTAVTKSATGMVQLWKVKQTTLYRCEQKCSKLFIVVIMNVDRYHTVVNKSVTNGLHYSAKGNWSRTVVYKSVANRIQSWTKVRQTLNFP